LQPSNEAKLRPLYDMYLGQAEEHLSAGWDYTNALPRLPMRVRLACAWPILIGMKTIAMLRTGQVPEQLPADVEYNVLRIAQEAITNAVKHSRAGTIEVTMSSDTERLSLTVRDDGVGFSVNGSEPAQPGHYGLIGMRERATQIHAELHLESAPGQGTTVRLELILAAAKNAGPVASGAGMAGTLPETMTGRNL
jgi:signal transduction histidine kinase